MPYRNKSVNRIFKQVFVQMKQKKLEISDEIRKCETQKSQYLCGFQSFAIAYFFNFKRGVFLYGKKLCRTR